MMKITMVRQRAAVGESAEGMFLVGGILVEIWKRGTHRTQGSDGEFRHHQRFLCVPWYPCILWLLP
jgi:hypothetical protein